jgi:hypothetical protein
MPGKGEARPSAAEYQRICATYAATREGLKRFMQALEVDGEHDHIAITMALVAEAIEYYSMVHIIESMRVGADKRETDDIRESFISLVDDVGRDTEWW